MVVILTQLCIYHVGHHTNISKSLLTLEQIMETSSFLKFFHIELSKIKSNCLETSRYLILLLYSNYYCHLLIILKIVLQTKI